MPPNTPDKPHRTQAERRATTRTALLDAAARSLARDGYAELNLERVAADAGYTRGALYHLFANKTDLALAALEREYKVWLGQVGGPAFNEPDPVQALVLLARNHAIYTRRDTARLLLTLRVEFHDREHPVGDRINTLANDLIAFIGTLITAARDTPNVPHDTDPAILARAYFGAMEGLTIELAGQQPHDEDLAERIALGILGLPPRPQA